MTSLEIPLSRGLVALVDEGDYDRVCAIGKWYANPSYRTFYARKNFWRDGRTITTRMHTLITGWGYVDHINGNGLDNRRINLREADASSNAKNRCRRSDNTTGFKCIDLRPSGRWRAWIFYDGRKHSLGQFETPEEAARAYDAAASVAYGEFARLNFPKGSS